MEDNKDVNTPLTQADIDKAVSEAVAKVNDEWNAKFQSKVNEAAKSEREKYEKKLKQETMSEAERLAAEQQETFNALQRENAEFKNALSTLKRQKALTDNQLPSHYEHDSRLINATDETFDNVVKSLVKENADYVKALKSQQPQKTAPKVGGNEQTPAIPGLDESVLQRYSHLK